MPSTAYSFPIQWQTHNCLNGLNFSPNLQIPFRSSACLPSWISVLHACPSNTARAKVLEFKHCRRLIESASSAPNELQLYICHSAVNSYNSPGSHFREGRISTRLVEMMLPHAWSRVQELGIVAGREGSSADLPISPTGPSHLTPACLASSKGDGESAFSLQQENIS